MERESAARIADLLTMTNRRLRRLSGPELERTGVTPGQLRVLRLLSAAGSPLRVSELARRLDVIPRSATSVVDLLEERGLVERRPDPDDRRATLVALTPSGTQVLRSLRAHRAAGLAQLLDRLTADEQAELVRLLTVLTADD
ncbi:MarR family winged helix-turn-helix transcriptional regulator [Jiangella rhizosphaerae]|nr:MarR family transcriptional regulator [Jiangella rhizosphaerae]